MRITLWGINYSPEVTGIGPYNTLLAEWLAAQGHQVSIVTTFPYYPAWEKFPGDTRSLYRREELDGVTIHRVWHYVPKRVTAARRIVHEASFVTLSFLRLLTLRRPDVVVVISPPLPLGAAAWALRLFRRAPYVFHVQDLQPDAAAGLGMLKPGRLIRFLYRLEAFAYRKADRVSGISAGMLEAYSRKGVPTAKQVLFPNPVRIPDAATLPTAGVFRKRHGIDADAFLVVYSGNIGVKQGLDQVLDAAPVLRKAVPSIQILICGEGAMRGELESRVTREGLESIIRFLPLQPTRHFHEMLADAGLGLVTQQAGSGAAFFPSKLLTLMAHRCPVLAVADAESAVTRTLRENRCGWVVPPDDPGTFAAAVSEAHAQTGTRTSMIENALDWVSQFETETVFQNFETTLKSLTQKDSSK